MATSKKIKILKKKNPIILLKKFTTILKSLSKSIIDRLNTGKTKLNFV